MNPAIIIAIIEIIMQLIAFFTNKKSPLSKKEHRLLTRLLNRHIDELLKIQLAMTPEDHAKFDERINKVVSCATDALME